jgi:6-phosphogluconolactonase
MTTTGTELRVLPSKDEVARQGAEEFLRAAEEAVEHNGAFSVALAGGSTPMGMYALLAGEPYRTRIQWERVLFFWGDERCVPPDHPDSNYGAAREALLSKLPVPGGNVHRMRGEIEPEVAAREYELLVDGHIAGDPPRFDLILLGMGDDGHTASLFPHTAALDANERLVTANYVPKLDSWRLTFTETLLNEAHRVIFLVTGEGKARAVKAVLERDPDDSDTYPSQLVRPLNGQLLFLLDEPAASLLSRR